MIRKPLYLFENDSSVGLDTVPVGSIIGIGVKSTETGFVQLIAKYVDGTKVTEFTTVGEAFEVGNLERVGSQPHKFNEELDTLTLRKDDIQQFIFRIKIPKLGGNITIPLISGMGYDAHVLWGDGSPEEAITVDTSVAHSYGVDPLGLGIWTIIISGTFPGVLFGGSTEATKVYEVLNLGKVGWKTMKNAFRDCTSMVGFSPGLSDTSLVTDASGMLAGCTGLTGYVKLPSLAYVTDFSEILRGTNGILSSGGLSTSRGTKFDGMYQETSSMLCIDGIDTRAMTSTTDMFRHSALTNPKNEEKGNILAGARYSNKAPCPQNVSACISLIEKSGGRYGFKHGLYGKPGQEYTSLGLRFFELSWDEPGLFIMSFGELGKDKIPNMNEILLTNNEKRFSVVLMWNTVDLRYEVNKPRYGEQLSEDYEVNNMRSLCFIASGKPSQVLWYDFEMKVGIEL